MWSPDHWKHETITCDVWSKLQTWMPNISGRLCLLLLWAKVSALRIREHHSYSIPSIYHSSGLSPAYLNQFSCWLDASTIAPRWNNPISFAVSWGPSLTRCSSLGDTTCHCANKGISPPDLTILSGYPNYAGSSNMFKETLQEFFQERTSLWVQIVCIPHTNMGSAKIQLVH